MSAVSRAVHRVGSGAMLLIAIPCRCADPHRSCLVRGLRKRSPRRRAVLTLTAPPPEAHQNPELSERLPTVPAQTRHLRRQPTEPPITRRVVVQLRHYRPVHAETVIVEAVSKVAEPSFALVETFGSTSQRVTDDALGPFEVPWGVCPHSFNPPIRSGCNRRLGHLSLFPCPPRRSLGRGVSLPLENLENRGNEKQEAHSHENPRR